MQRLDDNPEGRVFGGAAAVAQFQQVFGLPLLFDQDLLAEDELYLNAGSLTTSMAVSPTARQALERPIRY